MYILNNEKVFYDVSEGESIVINFVTGNYYCFNTVGAALFEFIVKGGDPHSLSQINKEGINDFLKNLTEKEILKEEGEPFIDIAFECKLPDFENIPVITEYDEVKNLILADPVDDVRIWE